MVQVGLLTILGLCGLAAAVFARKVWFGFAIVLAGLGIMAAFGASNEITATRWAVATATVSISIGLLVFRPKRDIDSIAAASVALASLGIATLSIAPVLIAHTQNSLAVLSSHATGLSILISGLIAIGFGHSFLGPELATSFSLIGWGSGQILGTHPWVAVALISIGLVLSRLPYSFRFPTAMMAVISTSALSIIGG